MRFMFSGCLLLSSYVVQPPINAVDAELEIKNFKFSAVSPREERYRKISLLRAVA